MDRGDTDAGGHTIDTGYTDTDTDAGRDDPRADIDDLAFVYAFQNSVLNTYDRTDPRSDFHRRYCFDPRPCRHSRAAHIGPASDLAAATNPDADPAT